MQPGLSLANAHDVHDLLAGSLAMGEGAGCCEAERANADLEKLYSAL